jgi:hypothetical protein
MVEGPGGAGRGLAMRGAWADAEAAHKMVAQVSARIDARARLDKARFLKWLGI